MSITKISPMAGREGTLADVSGHRARKSWLVLTNSRTHSETEILNAGWGTYFPIPWVSYLESNQRLLCRSLNARQDERAPLKWYVSAEYSSEPISLSMLEAQTLPPLDRPFQVRFSKHKYMRPAEKDIQGKPFTNSANDPVDPPIELPRAFPVMVVTYNKLAVPSLILTEADPINLDEFFITDGVTSYYVGQYQARLDDFDSSNLIQEIDFNGNLWQYYKITLQIEVNQVDEQGWLVKYLDRGYREYRSGSGTTKKYPIMDDSTPPQPITTPALLNGGGGKLAANADPQYITRHGYREISFNALLYS